MFDKYLAQWRLKPDGQPLTTHASRLLPVLRDGQPAMLKIAIDEEEKAGARLMVWWQGRGTASVLASDEEAILLERATSSHTLAGMVQEGRDDEASRILCDVVATLDAHRPPGPATLIPLAERFAPLIEETVSPSSTLGQCASLARDCIRDQQEICVLHGDIHHGNILDFGQRGWLAIDPKGVLGDRCFEYANILGNPDPATATRPGRLNAQIRVIAERAGLDPRRLLKWTIAYCGLSAIWSGQDGQSPAAALKIAREGLRLLEI